MIIVGGALINLYSIVYKLSKEDICRTFIDELIIGNEYYGTMNFYARNRGLNQWFRHGIYGI